jgi:WD40 repeat protein
VTDPLNLEMVVFNAALELPVAERAAYLETACAGNAELLGRLHNLLQAHEAAGDFLTEPALETPSSSTADYHQIAELSAPGFGAIDARQFSSDSRFLEIRYQDLRDARKPENDWVWDMTTQKAVLTNLPGFLSDRFSPDGRLFGKSYPDGTFSIYEPASGKEIKHLNLGQGFAIALISPDNTRVAAMNFGNPRVEIRELDSGSNLLTLNCPMPVSQLAWSHDGKRLAALRNDGQLELWNLRLIRHELAVMKLDWDQPPYPPVAKETTPKPVTMEIESETKPPIMPN